MAMPSALAIRFELVHVLVSVTFLLFCALSEPDGLVNVSGLLAT